MCDQINPLTEQFFRMAKTMLAVEQRKPVTSDTFYSAVKQ